MRFDCIEKAENTEKTACSHPVSVSQTPHRQTTASRFKPRSFLPCDNTVGIVALSSDLDKLSYSICKNKQKPLMFSSVEVKKLCMPIPETLHCKILYHRM